MSTVLADSSFLFSLYGGDANTAAAQNCARRMQSPLTITALNRFELGNAIRFAAFRKVISRAEGLGSLAAFEADLKQGHVHLAPCDVAAIVAEATRLSELHTFSGGHRSFDILHVAAARILKATMFLTFDANQRKLAVINRLECGP